MPSIQTIALAAVAALAFSASALAQPQPGRTWTSDPRVDDRTYVFEDTGEELPYCVYASSKIDPATPAPLVFALHGLGAPPAVMCNATAIDLAEEGGYIYAAPMGYSVGGWYGAPRPQRPASPPGATPPAPPPGAPPMPPQPENLGELSEKDAMNVLAMVREEFNVDPSRIYLTGHSMGGAGTLYLGAKHADIWAAIAPVAPAAFWQGPERDETIAQLKDGGVPVMLVHGATDEVVPVDVAHGWVAAMEAAGIEHEYVEMPDVTHGPVIQQSQADVFRWFAAHTR